MANNTYMWREGASEKRGLRQKLKVRGDEGANSKLRCNLREGTTEKRGLRKNLPFKSSIKKNLA